MPFDGDQMAVHILILQKPTYNFMLCELQFLSPSNGEPIIMPSQDMVPDVII
jgi:DNA-directed RNA polymerase beta' subunit